MRNGRKCFNISRNWRKRRNDCVFTVFFLEGKSTKGKEVLMDCLKVLLVSFAYPYGVPEDADDDYWGGFVFDCRLMPDPHGDTSLRGYSGLDKPVIDFFERHRAQVDRFLDAAESLVRQSIEVYLKNGRDFLQVAFGCRGGHHRSVYLAERFAERLTGTAGIEIEVRHTARQNWNA